jgi:hypothetical protein
MNPKAIFKLFSPKGKAQSVAQQGVSTLIIRSVALSLLALTICAQVVLADEPAASKQPGIEALSTAVRNEVDPDQDVGLLEFFSPGIETPTVMPREAEVLLTIETDVGADLGLMEFFRVPNRAGAPEAIEADANQDIGLMEFSPQAPVDQR